MKRVLITGANSYIGLSFERYIQENYPSDYEIDTVDMIDGTWREKSFSGYDSVFHVAGIAHSDDKKIGAEEAQAYYKINTDLAIETAKKAKADGVKQFVFMSSSIVYGHGSKMGKEKRITNDTLPAPANCYGDSKLQAENGITPLGDETFKVVILRPPMIYGKDCKGNYPKLSAYAKKFSFFPKVENERSMLYVENLTEFVRLMIENEESGLFFPQNAEYGNTSKLVKTIATANGKKIRLVKGFGWCLKLLGLFTGIVDKVFGSLMYDFSMSEYKQDYRIKTLLQSIEETEK